VGQVPHASMLFVQQSWPRLVMNQSIMSGSSVDDFRVSSSSLREVFPLRFLERQP
jgi:hypothetical protein